jgi:hypothetical protein
LKEIEDPYETIAKEVMNMWYEASYPRFIKWKHWEFNYR